MPPLRSCQGSGTASRGDACCQACLAQAGHLRCCHQPEGAGHLPACPQCPGRGVQQPQQLPLLAQRQHLTPVRRQDPWPQRPRPCQPGRDLASWQWGRTGFAPMSQPTWCHAASESPAGATGLQLQTPRCPPRRAGPAAVAAERLCRLLQSWHQTSGGLAGCGSPADWPAAGSASCGRDGWSPDAGGPSAPATGRLPSDRDATQHTGQCASTVQIPMPAAWLLGAAHATQGCLQEVGKDTDMSDAQSCSVRSQSDRPFM